MTRLLTGRIAVMAMSAALTFAAAMADAADTYPMRPPHMIVTFAAGGSSDIMARTAAKAIGDGLGETVVVENKPGAGGNVGAEYVAHAAPDGYTMLFGTIGTMGIGPSLYKHLNYDPLKDLAPVGILHELPNVLIVHVSLPVHDLKGLIAYAKAHPGQLTFASAGSGTVSHLSGELFKEAAGIDIVHVPYHAGGGSVSTDLIAGRVSMMLETVTNAMALVKTGELRALAVTTPERSKALPDLPTFAEAGLPGFAVSSWTGLFVPAGTPAGIIQRLNTETQRIAHDPAYIEQMKTIGTDVAASTPEQFGAFVHAEVKKWGQAIKQAGVTVE
ncbi:MAG TPA: tripartite tricarboxylate transporter substrate binding protein [Alphaproteobacteria bacterium]|nr:tripartite tricarboxylate transporter substrate binding protein [Alphaproteobacteria bacterium]